MLKRSTTFAALSAALLTAFSAQAQVTVDGVLNSNEGYHLVGMYDGGAGGINHSVPNQGLVALYATSSGSNMNLFVVGDPEDATDYKAILIYLDVPGATGVAAGTMLAGSSDGGNSQFNSHGKLDFAPDYGFRATAAPQGNDNVYYSRIDFQGGAVGTGGTYNDLYLGNTNKSGGPLTAGATNPIPNAQVAYTSDPTLNVSSNTMYGFELQVPFADLNGLTASDQLTAMVVYANGDASWTSDMIPQDVAHGGTAYGADADVSTGGPHHITFSLTAIRKMLANGGGLSVAPNPVVAGSRLHFALPAGGAETVGIEVYNNIGQKVMTLTPAVANASTGFADLSPLQALNKGQYFVKVQNSAVSSSARVVVQ